ncbi:MAG: hypothetical protein K9W46_12875 [Candidatus Heimdallarchaeum endolithica]|uniref:Uncharacterized protein n=1 Tax=Candidatus Heimdallarchaeum endolithica TaxID=2876572 RepID=A0A9Y1BQM1_9ARCH|nr:MAG: hypothetical protein K9W46_12875 [Candidatus Heimdallarchaeum endolithica]
MIGGCRKTNTLEKAVRSLYTPPMTILVDMLVRGDHPTDTNKPIFLLWEPISM